MEQTILFETKIVGTEPWELELAAQALREGYLVGMPTETVYGLAANAVDETAVSSIFRVKGRPQDNPLIIHISDIEMLPGVIDEVPEEVQRLAEAFWPGPLTMICLKADWIPSAVTAGLSTVAVRLPSHPAARELIRRVGMPLAAPSANRSGRPSPTTAQHVYRDLQGTIPYVIDGGPCEVGLESTIVQVGENARLLLLRPGAVTVEQLQEHGFTVEIADTVELPLSENETVRSPGMKYKHYAPDADVVVVRGSLEKFTAFVNAKQEENVCALLFDGEEMEIAMPSRSLGPKDAPDIQASNLFAVLRQMDADGIRKVYARCPEKTGIGLAVYNRILRAAGFQVVDV